MTIMHGEAKFPSDRIGDAVQAAQEFIAHNQTCKACLAATHKKDDNLRVRLLCDEGLMLFTLIASSILVGTAEAFFEAEKNATVASEH